ncbi:MAG: RidA family protein [Candidatus Aminicenantes bacterium]|nr:MAG: RidA family protein [Candidatus Aminicenantes bacterium]
MKHALLLLLIVSLFISCSPKNTQEATSDFDVYERMKELKINLRKPDTPVANYVPARTSGNLVFLSGHGPLKQEGGYVEGKVGKDLTLEEGYEAARLTGLALLSSLEQEIGDLNRVKRFIKVLGMVNLNPSFTDMPKVINGFSDLMVDIFGERGKHARSAVGMASLPANIAVEIEMIVEIE